jgi:hypothetical protein
MKWIPAIPGQVGKWGGEEASGAPDAKAPWMRDTPLIGFAMTLVASGCGVVEVLRGRLRTAIPLISRFHDARRLVPWRAVPPLDAKDVKAPP